MVIGMGMGTIPLCTYTITTSLDGWTYLMASYSVALEDFSFSRFMGFGQSWRIIGNVNGSGICNGVTHKITDDGWASLSTTLCRSTFWTVPLTSGLFDIAITVSFLVLLTALRPRGA